MRMLQRSLAFAVLTLLWSAGIAAAQSGSVTGRITAAEDGRAVVGALVEVLDAGGRRVASSLSNQDGVYRISGVPAGAYTMSAAAVGFSTQTVANVQIAAGGTATADASLETSAFELNPVVVTASKRQEKALEAPARVEVVNERDIDVRPALTPVEHLRSTPAVDVITSGLQSTYVVVRGFNNIFSGALHTLTDNRIAGLPSLRVNLIHFIPQTNDDYARMEVVLGPGSALYGPNTASGVLHIITKSPLDEPGTTFSISGGEKSVFHITGRSAQRLGETFGIKLSGQYFQGNEWRFTDPVETAARQQATTNFNQWRTTQPLGLTDAQLQQRATRVGVRDFDIQRWSFDTRADWRPTSEFSTSLSAGWTSSAKGIELTGIGAGQAVDWLYAYYQARFNLKRWFAQVYLNTSDAGDTYLLRTGAPIIDKSTVLVTQIQHTADLGNRQEFTYGADLIRTNPVTEGTINGSRENDDTFKQYGVYLQSRTSLSPQFDVVLAVREDWHTELNDPVFSPRAALVFKPTPEHNFRATYNRAFSTPSSLNLFLDIDGGPAGALGPLGFRVRAQGPGKAGIRLADAAGMPLGMRVPGLAGQLIPVTGANLYDAQLNLLIARLSANPATAGLVPLMRALGPAFKAGASQIPIATLNPVTTQVGALAAGSVTDIPGSEPSISEAFELGYQGLIGERLLLSADIWRESQTDFTSPLVVRTPLFFLNPQLFGGFLQQNAAPQIVTALVQSGMPLAQAQATAGTIITSWVQIPGGVASSNDVAARGADLLATYVNFPGDINLWGIDVSAKALLSDVWSLGVTASHTSDHNFCLIEVASGQQCPNAQLVALNAPKDKGSATLGYRPLTAGFSAEVRARYTGEFPVNSADFIGLKCIGGSGQECVESFFLMDLTMGYDLPSMTGAAVQLSVSNVFDKAYRSFVGVPEVGRLALLRLRYEF